MLPLTTMKYRDTLSPWTVTISPGLIVDTWHTTGVRLKRSEECSAIRSEMWYVIAFAAECDLIWRSYELN
jgi:hypothetical protein